MNQLKKYYTSKIGIRLFYFRWRTRKKNTIWEAVIPLGETGAGKVFLILNLLLKWRPCSACSAPRNGPVIRSPVLPRVFSLSQDLDPTQGSSRQRGPGDSQQALPNWVCRRARQVLLENFQYLDMTFRYYQYYKIIWFWPFMRHHPSISSTFQQPENKNRTHLLVRLEHCKPVKHI